MSTNPYQSPDEIVPAILHDPESDKADNRKILIAQVCLHISALLYLALGFLFFALFYFGPAGEGTEEERAIAAFIGIMIAAMCVGMAVVVEIVTFGVYKRMFWGWIGGLILFGLYAPSLFFPLGIIGLWALLSGNTPQRFKKNQHPQQMHPPHAVPGQY